MSSGRPGGGTFRLRGGGRTEHVSGDSDTRQTYGRSSDTGRGVVHESLPPPEARPHSTVVPSSVRSGTPPTVMWFHVKMDVCVGIGRCSVTTVDPRDGTSCPFLPTFSSYRSPKVTCVGYGRRNGTVGQWRSRNRETERETSTASTRRRSTETSRAGKGTSERSRTSRRKSSKRNDESYLDAPL